METLKQAFAFDYRSLRLFRILLGIGLIFEAISLGTGASDFLTDAGVYPRSLQFAIGRSLELWTPLNLYGSVWWPMVWLAMLAALGALIAMDRYPRLLSLLAYCVLNALVARNPYIVYGSDKVLQALLFWSMFLPAGRKPDERGNTFSSGVTAAVLLQIVVIYAVAGFAKSAYYWWTNPIASYLALQGDAYATEFGKYLTMYPKFLGISTQAVFLIERFGWILLFIPWRNGILRLGAVAAFSAMHVAFGMSLNLQLFPYFDIVLLSIAIPSLFWDRIGKLPAFFHATLIEEPVRSFRWMWSNCAEPIAMVSIALIIWVASHTMPSRPVKLPSHIEHFLLFVGIHQAWDLFAPHPYLDDGWFFFMGHSESGRVYDLFTGSAGPHIFQHPGNVVNRNPSYRWTAYLFQMRRQKWISINAWPSTCANRAGIPQAFHSKKSKFILSRMQRWNPACPRNKSLESASRWIARGRPPAL